MEKNIPINVTIADRSYRVRIQPEDEEVLRSTVKLINDKVIEFKTHFSGKDMQDYIAMVILWYATQQKAAEKTPPLSNELFIKNLSMLEAELDKALPRK